MNGKKRTQTNGNFHKWNKTFKNKHKNGHIRQTLAFTSAVRQDKSHTQAADARLCHWSWALEEGVAQTRRMGQAEESWAPVAALEWGPRPTHQRGLSGVQDDAPRAGAEPGCGSESAGGCLGILPDS